MESYQTTFLDNELQLFTHGGLSAHDVARALHHYRSDDHDAGGAVRAVCTSVSGCLGLVISDFDLEVHCTVYDRSEKLCGLGESFLP